jgi:hypothetical protein
VTGRVFGSYGYRYVRWSEPAHEVVLESDGPWALDRLFEQFPQTMALGSRANATYVTRLSGSTPPNRAETPGPGR